MKINSVNTAVVVIQHVWINNEPLNETHKTTSNSWLLLNYPNFITLVNCLYTAHNYTIVCVHKYTGTAASTVSD